MDYDTLNSTYSFEILYFRPIEPYLGLLCFCLWTVTVPFYTAILLVIAKAIRTRHPELSTPFFKIVLSSGIIDLVTLLNNYFGSVFPKWGYFLPVYEALGPPYSTLYLYLAWSTGINQAMSVSVLATNRLSAMLFPNRYHKMWRSRRMRIAYALQLVPGLATSLPIFFNQCVWERVEKGLVAKILTPGATTVYFTIGGFFLSANSFYLVCAYAYLYKIIRQRNKKRVKGNAERHEGELAKIQNENKVREYRLFLMATSIVAVQLTILLFFSTKLFPWTRLTTQGFYMFYNSLSDLYSGVNPYLLWIFSTSFRAYFKSFLPFRKKEEKNVIVSVVSQNVAA